MDDNVRCEVDRVDMYANHLCLADFGRQLAQRLRTEAVREPLTEAEYLRGYAQAVHDIAGHLEAGEGLPGGPLYVRAAAAFAGE